jgi:2-iminobutanoate/2-iminopropanoate deaminase
MADGFNSPGVVKPFGAFSNAAWATRGRLLFISGQVALDELGSVVGVGDVRAQTRFILENIGKILGDAGGSFDDIVSVNVFLTRMSDLAECHEVRRTYFKPPYPASTLVQVVSLVQPELLVEINAVATIGS